MSDPLSIATTVAQTAQKLYAAVVQVSTTFDITESTVLIFIYLIAQRKSERNLRAGH